jgi:hypothetical protein
MIGLREKASHKVYLNIFRKRETAVNGKNAGLLKNIEKQ